MVSIFLYFCPPYIKNPEIHQNEESIIIYRNFNITCSL